MATKKTNRSLVAYAISRLGTGYVYGTFGQILTAKLLDWKIRQYPNEVGKKADYIRTHWLNRPVQDCVGLIKGHLWTDDDGVNEYQLDNIPDISADGMFNVASEKALISSMPEIKGLLVWKKGHIGVYIGKGEVVESHGTKSGVIKTRLTKSVNDTKWTHWLKCSFIDYLDQPSRNTERTYEVQRCDTLWSIAGKLLNDGRRFKEIADLNGIKFPYVIHQKQVLKVPEK